MNCGCLSIQAFWSATKACTWLTLSLSFWGLINLREYTASQWNYSQSPWWSSFSEHSLALVPREQGGPMSRLFQSRPGQCQHTEECRWGWAPSRNSVNVWQLSENSLHWLSHNIMPLPKGFINSGLPVSFSSPFILGENAIETAFSEELLNPLKWNLARDTWLRTPSEIQSSFTRLLLINQSRQLEENHGEYFVNHITSSPFHIIICPILETKYVF